MKSLGIVIPAYNVEKYIAQCLDSVFCQTAPFDEVIVVNDGATDGTGDIVRDHSRFSEIKYVEQPNRGLSAARNTGIRESSAEFLIFLDGDDFVDPELCGELKRSLEINYHEIIVFGLNSFYDDEPEKVVYKTPFSRESVLEKSEAFFEALERSASACIKCFHRNLLVDDVFPVGKKYEDLITVPKLMYSATSVGFLKKHLYYYRLGRPGSIRANMSQNLVQSFHNAYLENSSFAKKNGIYKGEWQRFSTSYFRRFVNSLIVDDLIVNGVNTQNDDAVFSTVKFALEKLESGEILNRQTIERFLPKDGTYNTYLYLRNNINEFKSVTGLLCGIQLTRKLTRSNSDLAKARRQLHILSAGRLGSFIGNALKRVKSSLPRPLSSCYNSIWYHFKHSLNAKGLKHFFLFGLSIFGIRNYFFHSKNKGKPLFNKGVRIFCSQKQFDDQINQYSHAMYVPSGDASILVMLEKWFFKGFFCREKTLIVLDEGPAFNEILEKLATKNYSCLGLRSDELLLRAARLKYMYYPWNVSGAQRLMRTLPDLTHIFIGHGESDKAFSCESNFVTYDKILVSGDSMVDRLLNNRVLTPSEAKNKIVKIGMPYIDTSPPNLKNSGDISEKIVLGNKLKILYAPTWEYNWRGVSYSSLPSPMVRILISVFLGNEAEFTFRPHPNTGSGGTQNSMFSAMINLIEKFSGHQKFTFNVIPDSMFYKFLATDHPELLPNLDQSYHKDPFDFDLILTDISSIATWAAACGKPFITLINDSTEQLLMNDGMERYPVLANSTYILESEFLSREKFDDIVFDKVRESASHSTLSKIQEYVIQYENPDWKTCMPTAEEVLI